MYWQCTDESLSPRRKQNHTTKFFTEVTQFYSFILSRRCVRRSGQSRREKNNKICVKIEFYFFSISSKNNVGGSVNHKIKKVWPETNCLSLCFWLVPLRGRIPFKPTRLVPFRGSFEFSLRAFRPFLYGRPPRAFTHNWWKLESDIWVRSFTTDDFISFRTYVDTPPPFLCRRSNWCNPKPSISISLFITVQFSHDCEIVSYAKPRCFLYLLLRVNKTLLL